VRGCCGAQRSVVVFSSGHAAIASSCPIKHLLSAHIDGALVACRGDRSAQVAVEGAGGAGDGIDGLGVGAVRAGRAGLQETEGQRKAKSQQSLSSASSASGTVAPRFEPRAPRPAAHVTCTPCVYVMITQLPAPPAAHLAGALAGLVLELALGALAAEGRLHVGKEAGGALPRARGASGTGVARWAVLRWRRTAGMAVQGSGSGRVAQRLVNLCTA